MASIKVTRLAAGIALASLLPGGCGKEDVTQTKPVVIQPALTEIVSSSVSDELSFNGVVRSAERANLAFRVGGLLTEIRVKEGDHVKQGDLLARLDARDVRTTLESAELRPHVLCQSSFDKLRMNGDRVQNVEIISGQLLKNQGEGGGHCVFDHHILPRLSSLRSEEYSAWSLMRRLHPRHSSHEALVVRNGEAQPVDNLISEIGMFTLHLDGHSLTSDMGYAGYLVRSKPATASEGGVHSGQGAVDSLACTRPPGNACVSDALLR